MEPKQKEYPAVDVTGDRSKARCCKQQYCILTWNVRSMNQANWKWSKKRKNYCLVVTSMECKEGKAVGPSYLDQHCPLELSVMMEMFHICVFQYDSH